MTERGRPDAGTSYAWRGTAAWITALALGLAATGFLLVFTVAFAGAGVLALGLAVPAGAVALVVHGLTTPPSVRSARRQVITGSVAEPWRHGLPRQTLK